MKTLLIATLMLGTVATANAGAVNFTPPQVAAIEEPARMGGSGAWLVPLVIAAVILLAISSDSDCKKNSGDLSVVAPC